MSELLTFDAMVEVRAADAKRNPRFSAMCYSGNVMPIAGWGDIAIDLTGADVSGTVPILAGHKDDLDNIVGQGVARIDGGQLHVEGPLTGATTAGKKVLDLARDGIALQASVGFQPDKTERIQAGEKVRVNGKQLSAGQNGLVVIRSGRLREVSLLPLGACPDTQVQIAARAATKGKTRMTTNIEIPDELKAAWDQPGLTDSQRVLARWKGTAIADENIRAQTEGFLHAALGGAIDYKSFETEMLRAENRDLRLTAVRAERPQPPMIHGSNRDTSNAVIEASLCMQAGVSKPVLEKQYDERTLDAATAPNVRGVGLQQLILASAAEHGYHVVPGMRLHQGNLRGVLEAAFVRASGMSTHSLTTMLTNLGHAVLLTGFNSIPQRWREVAAVKSVNDFKETTAYRMTADLEYEELPPAGEIKHGTLGQETYTLQAKTYAKMLGLTRQDIINDNLGAFDDLRTRIGMGAAIKLNKVFWTAWLAASAAGTFWTSGRGNLATGAGSAFDEDGLNASVKLFRAMMAVDGNALDLEPDRVLVPPSLEATAKRYFASTEIRDTSADTLTPTANIHQGRFRPVVVPQLESSAYTGYSSTGWWMLADPALLASAAVCFLNGVQTPIVESADADFDMLGIQFRGYHDFGISMSEWRASVKNVGA